MVRVGVDRALEPAQRLGHFAHALEHESLEVERARLLFVEPQRALDRHHERTCRPRAAEALVLDECEHGVIEGILKMKETVVMF